MASLIERVGRQALRTFSQKPAQTHLMFQENFAKLKAMADQLTAADVNLNIDNLETSEPRERSPPVIYISVYEDSQVNIGIFIVKSGEKLPLHDHPQMYGILKVIAGTVKIQSYTVIPNTDIARSSVDDKRKTLSAIKLPEITVSENNEACYLTPTERNVHEIHSVDGTAAFLDILSPPYDTSDVGERSCHYFKEQHNDTVANVAHETRLMFIPSPPEYWSAVATYKGPRLRFPNEQMN